MLSFIWHTFFFDPVYNALVFFIDVVPSGDVGIAIILATILVKTILLPLSLKAARTQFVMREIEPELKAIREKFKDKREEQARAMMEAYRNANINPFSTILLIFIQLPIVIALYFSIARGGGVLLPEINTEVLYSFVPIPTSVSMFFLGLFDITARSIPFAALAAITQFIHTSLALPKRKPREKNAAPDFKEDFAQTMQFQMRFVMPIVIFFAGYFLSAAIALYFTISNLSAIAQEYVVRKKGFKHTD